jgi:hypothetical protein
VAPIKLLLLNQNLIKRLHMPVIPDDYSMPQYASNIINLNIIQCVLPILTGVLRGFTVSSGKFRDGISDL